MITSSATVDSSGSRRYSVSKTIPLICTKSASRIASANIAPAFIAIFRAPGNGRLKIRCGRAERGSRTPAGDPGELPRPLSGGRLRRTYQAAHEVRQSEARAVHLAVVVLQIADAAKRDAPIDLERRELRRVE